jgi:elongation factor P--beta-lysine ligase
MTTTKLMMVIHNVETDEYTEREYTAEEYAAHEAALAEIAAHSQRAADRAALLVQLGITEEQAQLLLG